MDMGGGGDAQLQVHANKPESKFLTDQAEYSQSCERLGSCLVEHSMMKSSTLLKCGSLPPYPSHIHLVSFT